MKLKKLLIACIKTIVMIAIMTSLCWITNAVETVDIVGCIAVYALYKSFRNDKD